MLLNRQEYVVEHDKLIYDNTHPIDGSAVEVKVTSGTDEEATVTGKIERGQLIYCKDGIYCIHANGGKASAIAAETVSYAEDDTTVTVPVYISGAFRKSEVLSDPEITDADAEELRGKGIFLK